MIKYIFILCWCFTASILISLSILQDFKMRDFIFRFDHIVNMMLRHLIFIIIKYAFTCITCHVCPYVHIIRCSNMHISSVSEFSYEIVLRDIFAGFNKFLLSMYVTWYSANYVVIFCEDCHLYLYSTIMFALWSIHLTDLNGKNLPQWTVLILSLTHWVPITWIYVIAYSYTI